MSNRIVFLDVETGCLAPQEGALLTLGACVYDLEKGEILPKPFSEAVQWSKYCVEAEALRINKLNPVDLYDRGLSPHSFLMEFQNWLDLNIDPSDKILLGGHNTHFDHGRLKFLIDYAIGSTTILAEAMDLTNLSKRFNYRFVDTASLALFMQAVGTYPMDKSTSLSKLCKFFNIELSEGDLHTSLADAIYTAKVFHAMRILFKEQLNA